MTNAWSIIKRELKYYGIVLSDSNKCFIRINNSWKQYSIDKIIHIIKIRINENGKFFEDAWENLLNLFENQKSMDINDAISDLTYNIFMSSIKGIVDLAYFLKDNFDFIKESLKEKICIYSREALDRDINSFPKQTINNIIEHKIVLDYTFKKMCDLAHIVKILRIAQKGYKKLCNYEIKLAYLGTSGPWANVDLSIGERETEWKKIDDDFRERTKDKRTQRRYEQGLEDYNNERCANYLREMRNEPFSWANRNYDSPYPSRSTLINYG